MSRTSYGIPLLAIVATLAVAGCGSGGSGGAYGGGGGESSGSGAGSSSGAYSAKGGGAYAAPNTSGGNGSGAANVSLASVPKLGLILVDSNGFTLYDFQKDHGSQSACYGACAKAWPPLLTEGPPTPGNGASAARLGTVERQDGTTQVTYAGHPLYSFVEDRKPGEARGNGVSAFGGEWYALRGGGEEAG